MRRGLRASQGLAAVEEDRWLAPLNDRRRRIASAREGMLEDFPLGSYFATDVERLCELAARRGVHHLDNLVAVPTVTG